MGVGQDNTPQPAAHGKRRSAYLPPARSPRRPRSNVIYYKQACAPRRPAQASL